MSQSSSTASDSDDSDDEMSASDFLLHHAKFRVPTYRPPSNSKSSSELQGAKLAFVELPIPKYAFYDTEKVKRLIDALEDGLMDQRLLPGPSKTKSYKEVKQLYRNLFWPDVEKKDKIQLVEWFSISTEFVSNLLTSNAMMNALRSATMRMFKRDIIAKCEPLKPRPEGDQGAEDAQSANGGGNKVPRPTTTRAANMARMLNLNIDDKSSSQTQGKKDRVDMIVVDLDNNENVLWLAEGKNPQVLDALDSLLEPGHTLLIDLKNNKTAGLKIFNKAIYYMLYWGVKAIVITSFSAAYILELHKVGSKTYVSYSQKAEQHMNTTLFRALFGLTLATLGEVEYKEFPIEEAIRDLDKEHVVKGGGEGRRRGGGEGGGEGSGHGSGPSKGGSGSGKKAEDTSKKRRASSSGQGRFGGSNKRPAGTNKCGTKRFTDAVGTDTDDGDEIAPKTVKTVPGETIESECQIVYPRKGDGDRHLRFIDREGLSIGSGLTDLVFERDSNTPFPTLPTSSEVPCLKLLSVISVPDADTTQAIVYAAELQHAENPDPSRYAVKVITASMQDHDEYRNIFDELVKEYTSYYVLALGKRDVRFSDVIRSITPTCYGLYRARDGWDRLQDVFVLIMEHAGQVNLKFWKLLSMPEKHAIMQSMICLHAIGLVHGDAAERNIAAQYDKDLKEDTYKVIDFGNSDWEKCPGIRTCVELRDCWWRIYGPDTPLDPTEYQLKTLRMYRLSSFHNLKAHYKEAKLIDKESIVMHLLKLSEVYELIHLLVE